MDYVTPVSAIGRDPRDEVFQFVERSYIDFNQIP